jgi:ankyrin repeat protein
VEVTADEVTQMRSALAKNPLLAQELDQYGWAPLQSVMRYGKGDRVSECVRLLLEAYPAAAQEKALEGWLPLHFAVRNMSGRRNALECVQVLLEVYPQAAQEKTPEGWLPLHLAAQHMGGGPNTGAVACTWLLLQAFPAAAQERLPYGTCALPLHLLAENEARPSPAMVQLLASAFPQALFAKDKKGRTPLQVAQSEGRMPADAVAEMRRLINGKLYKEGKIRRRLQNLSWGSVFVFALSCFALLPEILISNPSHFTCSTVLLYLPDRPFKRSLAGIAV